MAAFDFAKIDEFPQSKISYGGDQMKKPFLKIALVMNLKGKPFNFFSQISRTSAFKWNGCFWIIFLLGNWKHDAKRSFCENRTGGSKTYFGLDNPRILRNVQRDL